MCYISLWRDAVEWCNGSTTGFDPVGVGSTPTLTAKSSDIASEGHRARARDGDLPKQVIEAILASVRTGKDAIVKKERGKWVVLESGRRLVYKEPD